MKNKEIISYILSIIAGASLMGMLIGYGAIVRRPFLIEQRTISFEAALRQGNVTVCDVTGCYKLSKDEASEKWHRAVFDYPIEIFKFAIFCALFPTSLLGIYILEKK